MNWMDVPATTSAEYAILGCGSVGFAVAEELVAQGRDVLILDKDESRVEALRDQDLNANVADIETDPVDELVGDREVILVMSSDIDANLAAVDALRATENRFIVARSDDLVASDSLRESGADVVINPASVIAEATLRSLESGELEFRARQLTNVLNRTKSRLAIVTHDNPDPDAIASAIALQLIADHHDVEADILYSGDIGHQENRAFVNLLGIELYSIDEIESLDVYDTVALIDHAMASEPPIDMEVSIVIDHYEPDIEYDAEFVDIRPSMAATSTILTKYLQEFDLTVTEEVATALLYGIRAETLDFKRETSPADLTAAAYLYPFANHETLEQVESPSMSPETLDVLAEAITNREVQGSHLISNAGFIRDRDALTQAAQHLLNLEGITTTAVFGIQEETIYLAARSKDIRLNIGKVLQEAFGEGGQAAGHSTQASVEIPLGIFKGIDDSEDSRELLLVLAKNAVRRRLLSALGVESGPENANGS